MRKHREARVRANQSVNGDTTRLIPPQPPRTAPSVPGIHAPSHVPSQPYADPYPYREERFVSHQIFNEKKNNF